MNKILKLFIVLFIAMNSSACISSNDFKDEEFDSSGIPQSNSNTENDNEEDEFDSAEIIKSESSSEEDEDVYEDVVKILKNYSLKLKNGSNIEKIIHFALCYSRLETYNSQSYKLLTSSKKSKFKKKENFSFEGEDITLESLDLSGIKELSVEGIEYLPISIACLKNVEILDFSNSRLSILPESILTLTYLIDLRLTNNGLTQIPHPITKMHNLLTLDLGDNYLKKLPNSFQDLKKLMHLSLDKNSFDSIPESIYLLSNLSDLDLSHNHIKYISPEINRLVMLETFIMNYNSLIGLPIEIKYLRNIVNLELKHNKLEIFPQEICQMPKLTQLNLLENPIKKIPNEILANEKLKVRIDRNSLYKSDQKDSKKNKKLKQSDPNEK